MLVLLMGVIYEVRVEMGSGDSMYISSSMAIGSGI
jgi:hypothetical protein